MLEGLVFLQTSPAHWQFSTQCTKWKLLTHPLDSTLCRYIFVFLKPGQPFCSDFRSLLKTPASTPFSTVSMTTTAEVICYGQHSQSIWFSVADCFHAHQVNYMSEIMSRLKCLRGAVTYGRYWGSHHHKQTHQT